MNMQEIITGILDRKFGLYKKEDGTYEAEIYADYRDEMSNENAIKICQSSDPQMALWDKLEEWYGDYAWHLRCELEDEVRVEMESDDEPYPEGLTDEEKEEFQSIMEELVYWKYPYDYFLKQEFFVNIMLDTGDGNYDYTLNSPYPCWYGQYKERLDEKSSLLWLARQQGYTKTQLWQTLRKGDMADPKGFLESCRVEVANLASSMATVTFLVRMSLEQLIELNRCIKLQERNGRFYDATKIPYCGYIVLDKETMTGLFDPWCGGGSLLDIQLEKDVRIPIRFIRSALPDGGDGYSIDSVYGMCGSAWRDTVKKIHVPKNIDEMEKDMQVKKSA